MAGKKQQRQVSNPGNIQGPGGLMKPKLKMEPHRDFFKIKIYFYIYRKSDIYTSSITHPPWKHSASPRAVWVQSTIDSMLRCFARAMPGAG